MSRCDTPKINYSSNSILTRPDDFVFEFEKVISLPIIHSKRISLFLEIPLSQWKRQEKEKVAKTKDMVNDTSKNISLQVGPSHQYEMPSYECGKCLHT